MTVKADLHVHTLLSPCADLDMSPARIVAEAEKSGISILGITDHNSTLQCSNVQKAAANKNIFILCGAEITSREEVHCLVFFENNPCLEQFQKFIENKIQKIKNNPAELGFQAIVDEKNNVISQVDYYLGMALNAGIDEIEAETHRLGGLFIPAHINRPRFGLISQLGFVPHNIAADALEIFNRSNLSVFRNEHPELAHFSFIKNSDAHLPPGIGTFYSFFDIENITFNEIKMALHGQNGRKVWTE